MITRICIPVAAFALLAASGCKKEETTPPDGEVAVADEADEVDEADEADEADEMDAEPEAEALMSKASFEETVQDHFGEISDCYLAALEATPELAGTINAEFTFDADGVPTLAAAESSSLSDEGVVACIAEAAKGWSFGKPKEAGMTMSYPIKLEPAE